MAQTRKHCLDCDKAEVADDPQGFFGDSTVYGLCDNCFEKLKKQDPEIAIWAFEGDDQGKNKN